MNILFASAEAHPFAKIGGLADVAGSLPTALQKEGAQVRVILPLYASVDAIYGSELEFVDSFQVSLGWRSLYCGLKQLKKGGIHYYFIDNQHYFLRDSFYGYHDDAERFSFFSKAILECILHMPDFKPDVVHCNDWHTALLPLFLAENYGSLPYFADMKTVFTIHNLHHQGEMSIDCFEDLLGLGGHSNAWEHLEFHGRLNCMKAGILCSDKLTTVSPSYAEEIKEPYWGEGLSPIIDERISDLSGILNGVPDRPLPFYKKGNPHEIVPNKLLDFKKKHKLAAQQLFSLPTRPDVPFYGMISRLVLQKGLDLVDHILHEFLREDVQIAFVGTGDANYENMLHGYAAAYPDKVATRIIFDNTLADALYAGADLFLMPSLFEPCGLAQMESMRYGTLPIVRETGGLKDSVIPYNEYSGEGTGFSFANYNAHELLHSMRYAKQVYETNPAAWETLMCSAAARDFSWSSSAQEYIALYRTLLPAE